MQLLRPALLSFALSALIFGAGCHGFDPPYSPAQKPAVEDLMAATAPTLEALQIPRAKVRRGGGPAATLMLVAQSPERFAGTVQVSGNELVSLAVNEDEYGLRWLGGRDEEDASLAPGYYSGPPSRCAVETLLGVDLEPDAFVSLLLGGAPLIDGPYEVSDRRWDRKLGRELLIIESDRYRQELRFAWAEGRWFFAGASTWRLSAGGEPAWLWTISHESMHLVGGELIPEKTQLRRPKHRGRGEFVINVSYLKQVPNPAGLATQGPADPPRELTDDSAGDDPDEPDNAGDSWDEWGDEDEGGWEEADGSGPADPDPDPDPGTAPKPAPEREIPPAFRGNPTGLTPRGDLCAGRP
ncbi:hypothetical protein G6O69_09800 [Pseudenhygromyxa sp. WMMC2535]|uniref:hypothetical protein n=1 Tax=Pseudenhygromyxa sp. WMMC2535 TaxID=2712867 RepID=UPI001553D058|nr:hypothetical protein [Pseudenhygromyxa sp. WMMC2535]NVB38125.1 hypothetical protein [Pseudenhygromyxa sp. WMMC2535]